MTLLTKQEFRFGQWEACMYEFTSSATEINVEDIDENWGFIITGVVNDNATAGSTAELLIDTDGAGAQIVNITNSGTVRFWIAGNRKVSA